MFVSWLWGGFAVDNPTLTRFFALHFLLPFLISGLTLIHIYHLHAWGSTNPLGVRSAPDKVPFHIYYTVKDFFGFMVFLTFFCYVIFFNSSIFSEVENYIPANPLVTPTHIVPEWYFLFAYSILRSVGTKLGGTIGLLSGVCCLLFRIPGIAGYIKGLVFYGLVKFYFWVHVACFCLLTAGGYWPVAAPYSIVLYYRMIIFLSYYALVGYLCALWDELLS